MIYALYDLAVCPASYDICTFLVAAKSRCNQLHGENPHIVFVPGPNNGFKAGHKKQYDTDEMRFRLNHILIPACAVFGLSYTLCPDREFAAKFVENRLIFSAKHADKPHFLRHVIDIYAEDTGLRKWFPEPSAHASRIVREHFRTKPFVITLRETYTSGRNSDVAAWIKFIDSIEDEQEVVLIRDTSKLHIDYVDSGDVCSPIYKQSQAASIDLDYRLALYRHASMNFTVGGGPTILLHYSTDIPYRTFKLRYDGYKASSEEFLAAMGLPSGSQMPWSSRDQKIIWDTDSLDALKNAYTEWRGSAGSSDKVRIRY